MMVKKLATFLTVSNFVTIPELIPSLLWYIKYFSNMFDFSKTNSINRRGVRFLKAFQVFFYTYCTSSHRIRLCSRVFHYRTIPFRYIHHFRTTIYRPDRQVRRFLGSAALFLVLNWNFTFQ